MRQSFRFSNLLLAEKLPEPEWLKTILLSQSFEGVPWYSLYFPALLAGTGLTCGIFIVTRPPDTTPVSGLLGGLVTFLVVIQLLMLPVNHGVLIANKTIPKVSDLGSAHTLGEEEDAWLVWEGKEGTTFLVVKRDDTKKQRKLITLPRDEIKRIEITGYDKIFRVLFADDRKDVKKALDNKQQEDHE